jgi:hypothetical protein
MTVRGMVRGFSVFLSCVLDGWFEMREKEEEFCDEKAVFVEEFVVVIQFSQQSTLLMDESRRRE